MLRLLNLLVIAGLLFAPLTARVAHAQEPIPVSPVWDRIDPEKLPPDEEPPRSNPDAGLQKAYDDGYWRGVGVVLTGWGAAYTGTGLLIMGLGFASGDGYGTIIALIGGATGLGIGLAQLIPGLVLVVDDSRRKLGHSGQAYDAGFDTGWGTAMTTYGAIFSLMGLAMFLLVASEGNPGEGLLTALFPLALGGAHIGFGVDSLLDGNAARKRLMTTPRAFHLPIFTIRW